MKRTDMRLRHRTVRFEIKAANAPSGDRTFSGYGAAFNNVDGYGEIIAPGAFARDLPKFLEDGFIGGLNHNWDSPIGSPVAAHEDGHGLFVGARLVDTRHAIECHTLMKAKVCKKLSIGFKSLEREYLETAEAVRDWWKALGYEPTEDDLALASRGATILKRVRLFEVSPVMRPANELATIEMVKAGRKAEGLAFDDHLRAVLAQVDDVCGMAEGLGRRKGLASERVALLRKMRARAEAALKATESVPRAAKVRGLEADFLALETDLIRMGIL